MLRQGADSLNDAELLAVCLGTGRAPLRAMQLASRLLARFGTIAALLDAQSGVLLAQSGLGPAKVAVLKASLALAERYGLSHLHAGPVLSRSDAVRGYLRRKLAGSQREIFSCLFLDTRHHLISYEALFFGTIDRASVYPREILRRALLLNAAAIIFAHNHPSGVPEPSASDIELTNNLRRLLLEIDVRVLDHLIIGRGSEVSFAERGLL
jgi:DNA repair protein RadC